MRQGKSDIRKRAPGTRPPSKEKEVRIKIKRKTAENLLLANSLVGQAKAQLEEAQKDLMNHTLPLLTERGLSTARVVEVTEKEPYELVVMVPK